MKIGALPTGTAYWLALGVQTVTATMILWYGQFPDSFLCSDGDYGFMPLFPPCPEPRPYEGLVLWGLLALGIAGGVVLPGLALLPERRTTFFIVSMCAFPIVAFLTAALLVSVPEVLIVAGVVLGLVLIGGLAALLTGEHPQPPCPPSLERTLP